jgi:hypothetical protein
VANVFRAAVARLWTLVVKDGPLTSMTEIEGIAGAACRVVLPVATMENTSKGMWEVCPANGPHQQHWLRLSPD